MFIKLMIRAHISISTNIIDIIKKYYNNDIPSLIHIYKHGLCITQNINMSSNVSIYLNCKTLDIYNIKEEIAFYNKENIYFLKDIKIIHDGKNSFIYINENLNKINFISSCNFCKNIQEIQFTETNISNNIIQNIDFGWFKKRFLSSQANCKLLLSDKVNGIIIKTNDESVIIYINVVVE